MKSLSPILSEINENVAAMFVRYWCKGTRTLISRNLFSIQQNLSPIDLRYGFYLSFWRRVKHKDFLDENVSCNGVRNFYCGGSLNNRRIGAAVPDTTLCVPVMFAIFVEVEASSTQLFTHYTSQWKLRLPARWVVGKSKREMTTRKPFKMRPNINKSSFKKHKI